MDGLIIFLVLFFLGLFAGKNAERRHLADLDRREAELRDVRVSNLRSLPGFDPAGSAELVVGEVTIASDYFKSFAAGLRNLFGGEVKSFETLQLRARREATVRMLTEARARGYNAVGNLRLESADIGGNAATAQNKARNPMVSILASGTAYRIPASPLA